MANTYSQIYIHVVVVVEGRKNLLHPTRNTALQNLIAGIISADKHELIAINTLPDHLHVLVGLRPEAAVSNLVRSIKINSSRFINRKRWVKGRFSWHKGFGAFSCSRSQLHAEIRSIVNQQQHHVKKTFHEEFTSLLDKFHIPYDHRYVFQAPRD